jgi:hypothetical protein
MSIHLMLYLLFSLFYLASVHQCVGRAAIGLGSTYGFPSNEISAQIEVITYFLKFGW